jgi:hypothetical protein
MGRIEMTTTARNTYSQHERGGKKRRRMKALRLITREASK